MNKDQHTVWENCLAIIRDNLPPISFRTWFEPIVPLRLENKILTIEVPSPFFYEYLEEHYIDIISKTLRKELGTEAKLEYVVVVDNNNAQSAPFTMKLPTQKKVIPQNKPLTLPQTEEDNFTSPFAAPGIKKVHVDSQLNPENSFSSFVEGECNRLARAAGQAVAENPGGTAFNPLMLHGDSGLGKTHLAQAIGIAVKERHPEKVVLYVSANRFQTQFTEATLNNKKNDFVNFYQMIDVLIIDDVHEFGGKEKTQNTFFHIFNHLHQFNKQVILTSDKAPVELEGFENRLLSRFKWGLTAEVGAPDYETRMQILQQQAYKDGIEIPDEVIEFLAETVSSNVRELEGSLISLLAQATLNKKEITIDLARQMVKKIVKRHHQEVTVDFIKQIVCDHFNIDQEILKQKSRRREIVQARQVAMYFSKNMTKHSLASIGQQIGGRDHATVLHAMKAVSNLLETDKKFKNEFGEIEKKIKSLI